MPGEVLGPGAPSTCTAVRSTLILGSLQVLRKRGHYERYLGHLGQLAPKARDEITMLAAPAWVPVAIAEAHYGACDALRLPVSEMLAIGAESSRVNAVGIHALIGLARAGGVDVWTCLEKMPASWRLMYQGGTLTATKTGPKDARVTFSGNCLARFEYWRIGMRGVGEAVLKHFCTRVILREVVERRPRDGVSLSVSWV